MTKEGVQVAVDTAFLSKLTEKDQRGVLFKNIMLQMGRSPVVHQYVYEEELLGNTAARKLVEEGSVRVVKFEEFLKDQSDKDQYDRLFRQAYKGMNGLELSPKEDIFTYRHDKENLGEIHTALMAQHLNIDLMVSHDAGAKKYIEEHMSSRRHRLIVWNIQDVFAGLASLDRSLVKWSDIKGVAKRLFGQDERYHMIRDCWQSYPEGPSF